MRRLLLLSAAFSLALPLPASSDTAQPGTFVNKDGTGLCRNAPELIKMPPEESNRQAQPSRWGSRDDRAASARKAPEVGARSPLPAPLSPPPLPSPPPSPLVGEAATTASPSVSASDAASIIVSGTRTEARAMSSPTAAAKAGATDKRSEKAPRPGPEAAPQSGQLTAGEHDDLLNPRLYQRYVDKFLKGETLQGVPRVDTQRVLSVTVRDSNGQPMPFVKVTLTCADGNRLSLNTLANGQVVFFPDLDRLGSTVTMTAQSGNHASPMRRINVTDVRGAQDVAVELRGQRQKVRQFDLALVVDTTGSMSDELEYLKSELRAIVGAISQRHPNLDIRIALIFYRDKGDEYITRTFDFMTDPKKAQNLVAAQSADGGGDTPEAMEVAMNKAMGLSWRPGAVKSLLLVADAPPHGEDVAATWNGAEVARAKRIQVVPIAASGVDDAAQYVMRAMAAATQSRYLFLTDDSGIGNSHAEPDVDCYLVTRLDALVRRVLDSQISGRRIEPEDREILRSVGTYDKGRCVLPQDL